MAVQYNSEKGKIYYPWKQAIKSLGAKPRTEITQEEDDWFKNPKYSPGQLQDDLVGQPEKERKQIIESYNIPTKELEKFALAQEHANDGVEEYKAVLASAGNKVR